MKTWRRVALGGLTAFQLGLASVPATAQVTIWPDNEARRAIRTLQDKLLELELGTRDRITAVDAAGTFLLGGPVADRTPVNDRTVHASDVLASLG